MTLCRRNNLLLAFWLFLLASSGVCAEAGAAGHSATILKVSSVPSGAEVLLDGEFVGTTPLALPGLNPGAYEISLRRPGFQTLQKTVEVDRHQAVVAIDLRLQSILELYYRRKILDEPGKLGNYADLMHAYLQEQRFDEGISVLEAGLRQMDKDGFSGKDRFEEEIQKIWDHQFVYGTRRDIDIVRQKIQQVLKRLEEEGVSLATVKKLRQLYKTLPTASEPGRPVEKPAMLPAPTPGPARS